MSKRLSYLGLARRAGALAAGSAKTEEAVRRKTACLVVLASDASPNTKKKFENMCSYHGVTLTTGFTRAELGGALGRDETAAAAFLDKGLADAFLASAD